jgi:hypothetical protein
MLVTLGRRKAEDVHQCQATEMLQSLEDEYLAKRAGDCKLEQRRD